MKKHELLAGFFDQRFTSPFEEALRKDKDYMDADRQTSEVLDRLLRLLTNETILEMVDNLVAAHNNCATKYGRVAYQCGFEDAVKLMFSLCEIGSGE